MADIGRPTKYSEDLVSKILTRISEGESVRTICTDPAMPAMSQIFNWLAANKSFQEQYARAKQESADAMAEDMLEIADSTYASRDEVAKAKLRVETRQWIASKLKPKKYGDRISVDGEETITHRFEDLDDEQLDAAIKARENRLSKDAG